MSFSLFAHVIVFTWLMVWFILRVDGRKYSLFSTSASMFVIIKYMMRPDNILWEHLRKFKSKLKSCQYHTIKYGQIMFSY